MQRVTPTSPAPSENAVDLTEYLGVLRRRLWLILGVTGLIVALAGAYSFTRTPLYSARAVVLILPASSDQFRPDQLISLDTEARVAKSAPVAEIAKEALGSPLTITQLLKRVEVEVTPDTLVLDIVFTDLNAQRAAASANAFASAYLEYKQDRAVAAVASERRGIQDRIDALEEELRQANEDIETAPAGSPELEDAELVRDTVSAQIAVLTSDYASVGGQTSPGEIILDATPPVAPASPKHPLNLAMGLFFGAFLGVVLAFVRDRTDDRITGRGDLELSIDAPLLAMIPSAAKPNDADAGWLVTERQPRSPAAEAYRTLRTAVMALKRQRGDYRVFAIVSPLLGEGKSTTTANLAVALSHTDSQVVALTTDLRRPSLHGFFDRDLGIGLTDVLLGEARLTDAVQRVSPSLSVISSGREAARPAELLQSPRLPALFEALRNEYDYVLVDCPPVLGLADSLSVSPFADAVILVARAAATKRSTIMHSVEQLKQVGARVSGVVLNDVPFSKWGASYGYGYGYGYGDDGGDSGREPKGDRRPRGRTREPVVEERPPERSQATDLGKRIGREEAVPPGDAEEAPRGSKPEARARADQ